MTGKSKSLASCQHDASWLTKLVVLEHLLTSCNKPEKLTTCNKFVSTPRTLVLGDPVYRYIMQEPFHTISENNVYRELFTRGAPELSSGRLVSARSSIFEGSGSGRNR